MHSRDAVRRALTWVSLPDGAEKLIWEGNGAAGNVVLNGNCTQLAFAVEDQAGNEAVRTFWYHRQGTSKAIPVADDQSSGMDPSLTLDGIQRFSYDGHRLYISLRAVASPVLAPHDAIKVHVWSYKDRKLQTQQERELNEPRSYLAVVDLSDHHMVRIQEAANEGITLSSGGNFASNEERGDDYTIAVSPGEAGAGEELWNHDARVPGRMTYLVSTTNGSRRQMAAGSQLSPQGRYAVHYDDKKMAYLGYEIATGAIRNLTASVRPNWMSYNTKSALDFPRGIAGWLQEDRAVLIYDRHDIWQVDLAGKTPPINLTGGYGRRHNIVFSLPESYADKAVAFGEKLVLAAFNTINKQNGFFEKAVGEKGEPTLLTMGPYLYYATGLEGTPSQLGTPEPQRARDADVYVVQRMSATEAPNYFTTTDFKTFTPQSDVHPERSYNWMTSELHSWKALDGRSLQGILYKPENFDPKRRYPVIFNYYESKSEGLNAYALPEPLDHGCVFNLASYVSNGYLVFTPDIYFHKGHAGQSAVNAVVSAAKYLAKMPWVNSRAMGIQGCSWGGFETGYLVTHTGMFAAAAISSGIFDFISAYGSLTGGGDSLQGMYENGQSQIFASLWERPDLYLENSSVLHADHVTTPVLIMHTTNDGVCRFPQAIEFFTGLRRLRKKAWLLQYDEGNHGLFGKEAIDFSVRMAQFFDHYLKGAPPPKWMTQGVPARLEGIETGLDLDLSGREP